MKTAKWFVAAFAALLSAPAMTQSYPARPVRVIVPFAPGGATDIVARIVSAQLTQVWGQQVVVDNRAGASGNIGGDLAAKAAPDGYTLFMTSGSIVTANQHLFKKMPFNPDKDLAAVTNVASGPQVIVVHPSFPSKSLKEFIAIAKGKPRSLTYGSAGVGTQTHLAAENFLSAAGIDLLHIPYKGEGPALVDLVGGQIFMATPNLSAAIGYIQGGKLRALAVTSRERSKQVPDIPAAAETLPGFENLGWFGFMVPAATPKAIIDKVYKDTAAVLKSADIRNRFEKIGMVPVGNTPDAFAQAIRQESAHWAKVIRQRNIQIN